MAQDFVRFINLITKEDYYLFGKIYLDGIKKYTGISASDYEYIQTINDIFPFLV